jgi:long-chain fatty acid transport protein
MAQFVVAMLATFESVHGQGITVHGVGPVNRSMGGAGTAAPLESIGALHWNPASLSALPSSEVSFGMELLLADIDLASTIGGAQASTSGEAGVAVIPAVGWSHRLQDKPVTIGLGMFGIAGFRNNMPADPANPLLASGPIFADAEFLQIAPTLSYAINDRLAIGIAPTATLAKLTLDPLGPSVLTPVPTPGSGNRVHWGGGAQVGLYYIASDNWRTGFTIKSPQYFEDFRFFTPSGVARFDLDYPLILSLGLSYSGFENWILAVDARFHDFKNADGFSELGWSSVFAAAVGAQYHVNDCLYLRAGYNFNQNPIQDADVLANIATPLIQDQNVSAGLSYRIAWNVDVSLAYIYLVNNEVTGPLPSALFGPNASLSNEISAHSAALGATIRY